MTTSTRTGYVRAARPGSRVGWQAAVGGPLFAAGVALEWWLNPQQEDGTVVRSAVFAALVGTSALGAALLLAAARRLPDLAVGARRSVRVGGGITTVGAGLLLVSMLAVLGTGLALGAPAGASFLPFALGLLLLAVGPVVLGLGLRAERGATGWALVVAGLAAFASVAVPLDPWHDVSLMVMCAAWSATGVVQRR